MKLLVEFVSLLKVILMDIKWVFPKFRLSVATKKKKMTQSCISCSDKTSDCKQNKKIDY